MTRPSQIESFSFLLATLLAMIVAAPLLGERLDSLAGVRLFLSGLYLASLAAVSGRRRVFWIGLALGVPALVSEWLTLFTGRHALWVGDALSSIVFLLFAAAVLLDTILRQEDVTPDTIVGGICVYLMLGILFGELCGLVEFLDPGSFAVGGVPLQEASLARADEARYSRFLYYSFVTLTTVGYGDVTPVSAPARSLAILEAVSGQVYLAVFMARLVGQHLAARREP